MTDFAVNRQFKFIGILCSVLLLLILAFSFAGFTGEADCSDDCHEGTGACCECICCPNNILMTALGSYRNISESGSFLWTIQRISFIGEQEWYVQIDRPPQNFS